MVKLFLTSLFLLILSACSDSESSAPHKDESEINLSGFVHLLAPQNPVVLGTDQDGAQIMDTPQMGVVLDYDYYIGQREVSCNEFSELMDLPSDITCHESGAVTNISFYDAVLYANARSKSEKKDTAYSYSKIQRDSKGFCINLFGLKLNAEAEGYRLPTEAEWVHAFNKLYDPEKTNESFAIFVKEWVNDWLVRLKDTTVTDFVGAVNGGTLDEHVLKGGDFSTENFKVDPYKRGDIYRVSSSTRINYVGFRLALGKIPNALWLTSLGLSADGSMSLLATSQDVYKKTRSYRVKLTFRNDISGNLVDVDFNNGKPTLIERECPSDCFHPDISPDGQWVAYSTGTESITGPSMVYVRHFGESVGASIPLNVKNASIPRFRVTSDGDTVLVYVTDSGNNTDDEDFLARSTWQVPFSNQSFGTPTKLFDGAYHGGLSQDEKLSVTGARLLRARKDGKHLVWYDSLQACNVSLSQDGSKRTLFLDFGGKTGQTFAGQKYGVHEQILIADSVGKLIQTLPSPHNYSFDHTEWVENTGLIVATLTSNSGNHEKIVLVDPTDSSFVNLVSGSDMYHPCVWVDENSLNVKIDKGLDVDSAGLYFSSQFLQEDVFWRYKMELLWKLKDSADVVILGSSRPLGGVRPKLMKNPVAVANLAQTPNSLMTSRDLAANYVLPHFKKLKYLVVSLDLDFWWKGDDDVSNFFKETYKNYTGFVYDKNHNFWKDGYPEGLYELTANAPGIENGQKYYTSEKGFISLVCGDWGGENPPIATDTTNVTDSLLLEHNFLVLQELVEMAEKANVVVIGAIFPQSPAYKNTGAFGRHGMRRSLALNMIDRIKKMESPYFILMDENKMGDHDYSDSKAQNYDHLCAGGAKLFSSRLDSLIASLE